MTTEIHKEKKTLEKISEMWANYRYRESHLKANQCILATRFASIILTYANIEHAVAPVGTCVYNQKGWEFVKNKKPFTKDGEEWSVKISVDNPVPYGSNEKAGHAIIMTENFYYDPSSEQMSRPNRQMEIPNSIIININKIKQLDDNYLIAKKQFKSDKVFHFPIMTSHYTWALEPQNKEYKTGLCWEQTPEQVIERLGFTTEQIKTKTIK